MNNRVKVLLIQPAGVQAGFTRSDTKLPPLGLLYIAAAIRQVAEVRLIDADAVDLDDSGVLSRLDGWTPDIVGMTASSLTFDIVCRFARVAKEATGARVIVGGPLPSAAPYEVLSREEIDLAAVGDGEPIMLDLCRALESFLPPDAVGGIVSKSTPGHVVPNSPRRADLSVSDLPAWDMIRDFGSYGSPDCSQTPVTIVEGQRGCPYTCSFCSVAAISGRKRRARPVDIIIQEIAYLTAQRGIREISFVDPDFMADPHHALAVSKGLSSLRSGTTWFCNARAISVKAPVARAMADAGCHLIYLGAESGDPGILARVQKHQTLEDIENACKVLRDSGIQPSVGFIIGFPFETDDNVRRTIEFARRLMPAKFQFSLFNWFPGISMEVPPEFKSAGFHPRGDSKWKEWQQRAYQAVGGGD